MHLMQNEVMQHEVMQIRLKSGNDILMNMTLCEAVSLYTNMYTWEGKVCMVSSHHASSLFLISVA